MFYFDQTFKTNTMKKRLFLRKYKHSTLNDNRILCVDILNNWTIEVKTLKESKQFYLVADSIGNSESLHDYSADYLLCSVQRFNEIEIYK